jgi:hypothetical protein
MVVLAMDPGPPAGNCARRMNATASLLHRQGYIVLHSVAAAGMIGSLHRYMLKFAADRNATRDNQVPGAISCYGDPVTERLLEGLVPDMERITGRPLYPTYAYFRVYRNGDILQRHRDRPACEFTLSLCIGYEGATGWPLCVLGREGEFAADLKPGDGLVFKGLECDHWREAFCGVSASMAFLHYVDREGPYSEWRFDKRADLHRVELEARNED